MDFFFLFLYSRVYNEQSTCIMYMIVIYQKGDIMELHTFQEVEAKFENYITKKEDVERIRNAYAFAEKNHAGQFRKSGEPYIHHLIEVAYILCELNAGPDTIIAGLLHDVVEDCNVPLEEIEKRFGSEVRMLVDALTKIQRMKLSKMTKVDFEVEDHKKIFLAMAKDVRVIIIKLADRLHNMRTLQYLKPERQMALSQETVDVFVPIAHRLGMYKLKSELEDICLSYLDKEKYDEISKLVSTRIETRADALADLKKKIADELYQNKLPCLNIESRYKSIYSIYKKMYIKGRSFDEIYDIMALRIITETEINCYEILGLIHSVYKPLPGRFKDYIAMPKPNMYQSLHTTILTQDGLIFEVQIRTKEMDEIAEGGVAAHWRYKEGKKYSAKEEQQEIEAQLHWFRDFVSRSDELSGDTKAYMESLKYDVFEANVYVFSPKGKVVDLPSGSCPLDFAYRIHTKIGDSAVGALVNGQLVPLNTVLKTGDVVEIKTSKTSPGPNAGWLKFVATSSARSHIKKVLAAQTESLLREGKIEKGRTSLLDAFRDRGYDENECLKIIKNNENKLLNQFGIDDLEQLYYQLNTRNITPGQVISFLQLKRKKNVEDMLKVGKKGDIDKNPVLVRNAGKVAINLGSCCTPIPGDDIIGYITKGSGITVHRTSCPNVSNGERLIEVFWNPKLERKSYPVDLVIEAGDRNNLLSDIVGAIASKNVSVTSMNAKSHPSTLTATLKLSCLVNSSRQLSDVIVAITGINSVYEVKRAFH